MQGCQLGANLLPNGGVSFVLWAPNAEEAQLHITAPVDRLLPMKRDTLGYHRLIVPDARSGTRYFYRVNGGDDRPDPASRFQPEGVHAASEVVDPAFDWNDQGWFGIPIRDYIIYELHVGTFSPEGSFAGVISLLPEIKALGVTAIEIMPVAQFPGTRNWGYDGVGLYAVQNSYGGPIGLKKLVNAAHQHGLAVILDVVYNHFGPEGNYVSEFGPYFSELYRTPWGAALNFDGPHSNEVRRFFIENALYWQTGFHIDALRLDAIHAIRDVSAVPFLRHLQLETERRAEQRNRRFYLIAESDLNAPLILLPPNLGGYGMNAQWADDFHHSLHVLLTGERRGYYQDYTGGIDQFAKVWRDGYAYTGQYSEYRQASHGDSTALTSLQQFVVCAQNHDQIGNRMTGDRLSTLVDFESLKLAAAAVHFSPFIPMIFMGEEYGETAPFQYIVDHGDLDLIAAVQKGRRDEFAGFNWVGEFPDPASEATFVRSRLNHSLREKGNHKRMLAYYKSILALRKQHRCFAWAEREEMEVFAFHRAETLLVHYNVEGEVLVVVLCFAQKPTDLHSPFDIAGAKLLLNSAAAEWGGPSTEFRLTNPLELSPRSALLLQLS